MFNICINGTFLAVQAYILLLWYGTKYKGPTTQACYFIWSLGASFAPFILRPFLPNLPDRTVLQNMNATVNIIESCLNRTNISYRAAACANTTDYDMFNTRIDHVLNNTDEITNMTTLVTWPMHIGFAYIGVLGLIGVGLCVTVAFIDGTFQCVLPNKKSESENMEQNHKLGKLFTVYLLAMLSVLCFTYLWEEEISATYTATYAIKGFGWTVEQGSLLTTVFWACHGLGGLLGIPLSAIFSPTQLLAGSIALSVSAFIGLTVLPPLNDVTIWICSALIGFALSVRFATVVIWASNLVHVGGRVTSLLFVASGLGMISGVLVSADLFQRFSALLLPYICLGASLVSLCAFLVTILSLKIHSHRAEDKKDTSYIEVRREENTNNEIITM